MSRITSIDRWLKANRCWRREHNIAHARYALSLCDDDFDAQLKAFWQLILERLGDG